MFLTYYVVYISPKIYGDSDNDESIPFQTKFLGFPDAAENIVKKVSSVRAGTPALAATPSAQATVEPTVMKSVVLGPEFEQSCSFGHLERVRHGNGLEAFRVREELRGALVVRADG